MKDKWVVQPVRQVRFLFPDAVFGEQVNNWEGGKLCNSRRSARVVNALYDFIATRLTTPQQ